MDHGALIQLKEEVCFEVVLSKDHGALGWVEGVGLAQ